MNELQTTEQAPEYFGDVTSSRSLVLDDGAMDKLLRTADLMAASKVTIPNHLQKNSGDCLAVVMQAVQWGMNPFSVAQKTHVTQGGQLGYEAQLINAVVVASGAVVTQPEFTFIGNWENILGKVKEMKSEKGGKYYVSDWPKSAENGLGVIVKATLRGEVEPREITVMLSQCYPRFSTQWATDPQQQITYVGVRKFARRYAPSAILGVYTKDELESGEEQIKDINPRPQRVNGAQVAQEAQVIDVDSESVDERANLVETLEEIASKNGLEAYAAAWGALTKQERQLVGAVEHERLKAIGGGHE